MPFTYNFIHLFFCCLIRDNISKKERRKNALKYTEKIRKTNICLKTQNISSQLWANICKLNGKILLSLINNFFTFFFLKD